MNNFFGYCWLWGWIFVSERIFLILYWETFWVLRVSRLLCRSPVCYVSAILHAMCWGEIEEKMCAQNFYSHFSFIFIQFVIKNYTLWHYAQDVLFSHWRSFFALSLIPLETKLPHLFSFFSSLQYIYRQIHDFITCIMNNNITICKEQKEVHGDV